MEVYHPDDPEQKKIYDAMKHVVPLPFGLSSYIAAHQTGVTGARAAAGFVGFTKAPYYVSYTPAEKEAFQQIRELQPIGARTHEQFQRGVQERIATDAIKRGEMTPQQAVEQGLVESKRIGELRQRVKQSPLQHAVKSLEANGAMKIMELSSPSERKESRSHGAIQDHELRQPQAHEKRDI